jgi:hypothetical protein
MPSSNALMRRLMEIKRMQEEKKVLEEPGNRTDVDVVVNATKELQEDMRNTTQETKNTTSLILNELVQLRNLTSRILSMEDSPTKLNMDETMEKFKRIQTRLEALHPDKEETVTQMRGKKLDEETMAILRKAETLIEEVLHFFMWCMCITVCMCRCTYTYASFYIPVSANLV